MRTTVDLDDDTAAAVEELRRELGMGVSRAVNELVRRGLVPRPDPKPFVQRRENLGLRLDVSNIAVALEDLEGVEAR